MSLGEDSAQGTPPRDSAMSLCRAIGHILGSLGELFEPSLEGMQKY